MVEIFAKHQIARLLIAHKYEPRNDDFACAKTKAQISCAVTAQLISAFIFAAQIVQMLYLLNPKFQASSHFLRLHKTVCV